MNGAKTRSPDLFLLMWQANLTVLFLSVPFSPRALQRLRDAFSRFLQPFLPRGETWVRLPQVLRGRGCSCSSRLPAFLEHLVHVSTVLTQVFSSHGCTNRSGLDEWETIPTSCNLASLSAFLGALETLPIVPFFSEITTYLRSGERSWSACFLCLWGEAKPSSWNMSKW